MQEGSDLSRIASFLGKVFLFILAIGPTQGGVFILLGMPEEWALTTAGIVIALTVIAFTVSRLGKQQSLQRPVALSHWVLRPLFWASFFNLLWFWINSTGLPDGQLPA